jgi:negative regulator of flagellin synthesis FlgM
VHQVEAFSRQAKENTMKIGIPDNKPLVSPALTERTGTAKTSDPSTQAGSAQDSATVALSSTASLLSTGAGDGSFDAAKVERIAQAIRDGKFTVNADKIADKLIANASELLQPRS